MSLTLESLNELTAPGDLYEVVDAEQKKIRCYACSHRCLLKDGRRGICQVRYNEGGVLRVPFGYVGALQVDPTEKKPFYHLEPGSLALSFGMLGCNLHCNYCFTGDTMVLTNRGPVRFDELFGMADTKTQRPDGVVAHVDDLQTVSASGSWRKICAVFQHPYSGELAVITPYYLPELRCTADHRVYATPDPAQPPQPTPAKELTKAHYLAVPRHHPTGHAGTIDVEALLSQFEITYQVPWKLTEEDREFIVAATKRGESSRQIGAKPGKSATYIRKVRSKIAHGNGANTRTRKPFIEDGWLRFPNEHRPGIPLQVLFDESLARLLGYYCAEGSIVTSSNRPNSHNMTFAFSPEEDNLANEVIELLAHCLKIKGRKVRRETTLGVDVSKASVAHFFMALAGKGAGGKRVPPQLFDAPSEIAAAFLDAYITGGGHRYENGKVSATTISRELAHGVTWLALKQGYMPSLYEHAMSSQSTLMGRKINRAPYQYTMVWYDDPQFERKLVETANYYLIPLRSIGFESCQGDVYNMEVDVEHNYLAGFLAVKNCQNWDISQFGRDANAQRDPMIISERELVSLARQRRARVVASTYNEPLITTEWAVSVFKQAQAAGLRTAYISSGNATPEVLAYLAPHLDAYKIDLKSMRDNAYRQLGAVLQHVLDTVQMVYDLGLWLEVVTLVVPGFNDSTEELWDTARFLAGISPDIPWHVTAFHPDYKMTGPPRTPLDTLIRAAEIGAEAGLRYVYAGNLPGMTGEWEDTRCPACNATLIKRYGFMVRQNRITPAGTCPECGAAIPGLWF